MWLNLYGHQAVRLKKGVKMHFLCVYHFFELTSDSLMTIEVEPHQCSLDQFILLTQGQSLNSLQKNIVVWRSWKWKKYWGLVELKMTFFGFGFLVIGFFKKKLCLFFPNGNQLGFHMRYHLFLLYGWFLQNLGKDYIRTNMHTTVCICM